MKRDKSFLYIIQPRAKMKVKFLSDKRMRKTFMAFLDCKAGYTGDQCVNKWSGNQCNKMRIGFEVCPGSCLELAWDVKNV